MKGEKGKRLQNKRHCIESERTLLTLGLATRAGRMCFGEERCLQAVRSSKAMLVFIDAEASPNTIKRFENACTHHAVPLWYFNRATHNLSDAVGRPSGKVFALMDAGFARSVCLAENQAQDAPPDPNEKKKQNAKPFVPRRKERLAERKENNDESVTKRQECRSNAMEGK